MSKKNKLQHLSLATTYEIDNSFDSDKFIKMRLRVCHDGDNPNRSHFEVDDMEKTKDSIKNIPILANVIVDENGDVQFGGHDMELEQSKVNEDEVKLIYKEVPIGVVPETCNHEIKEFDNKNYVFCDAYIWKGYANYAEDIINRDENIKLSMEIIVDSYNYNGKEKIFNIIDYRYQGITFLNKNYDTGMENALATTSTFAEEETKEKFIMIMEELKDTLTNYNIDNTKKGGSKVDEQIIALLDEYGVNQEDIPFDIEGLSFEEIESKLKELNNNNTGTEEKYIKSFELSHNEIRYALYNLLAPVEAEDNEWYFIDQVYDDRFEYENWEGTKIYRQEYKKEDDIISFVGERIELFQERLTKEEKEALDEMRNNYSKLLDEFEEYKNNYSIPNKEVEELREFKSQKLQKEREEQEAVLFAHYDEVLDVEDEVYKQIKENKSNFSIEQLEEKLAVLFARKQLSFSSNKNIIKLGADDGDTGEVSPYGNLFEKHQTIIKNKEEN